jgi:hypothetical protein
MTNTIRREQLVEILGQAIKAGMLKSVEWEVVRDSIAIAADEKEEQISLVCDAIEWLKQDFFKMVKAYNPENFPLRKDS